MERCFSIPCHLYGNDRANLFFEKGGKHIMASMYDKIFYPYLHICSENWAYTSMFNFAITTAGYPIERNILESITKEKIALGNDDTLWVTHPFKLEKDKSYPIILTP